MPGTHSLKGCTQFFFNVLLPQIQRSAFHYVNEHKERYHDSPRTHNPLRRGGGPWGEERVLTHVICMGKACPRAYPQSMFVRWSHGTQKGRPNHIMVICLCSHLGIQECLSTVKFGKARGSRKIYFLFKKPFPIVCHHGFVLWRYPEGPGFRRGCLLGS